MSRAREAQAQLRALQDNEASCLAVALCLACLRTLLVAIRRRVWCALLLTKPATTCVLP